ncbi:AsmA family protein [Sphingomonas sp. ac-8]|uniref:AsmA family protein n=1 Tax=Sphingomonas sp. ac-8 TaxID=3242977 RepID=UPI003A80F934
MADRDDAPLADPVPPSPAEPAKTAPPRRARPRWLTIVLRVLLGILVAIFLVWAILFVTKGRFLKHTFEKIASSSTERQVRVAGDFQFYFNPINLKFLAEGITVSNPAWAGGGNFFEAKKLDSSTATLTFLFGKRRINWVALDGARVDLAWDADHRRNSWTFGDPNAKGEPFDMPVVRQAAVTNSGLRYSDPSMRLLANLRFHTVEAKDTKFASAIRFDGDGRARGTPFTLTGALLSPDATLAGGRTQLALTVRAVDTVATVSGTLPEPTVLEGADLNLDVRGRNLANLFLAAGMTVPDTRRYHLASALTKDGEEWRFTKLKGTFGDSDLAGRFSVFQREPRMLLTADIATRRLDIVDAAPFIGYNPDKVATQGKAGAVTQVAGRPRLLPDTPLNVDALKNFDAKVEWTVQQVRSKNVPVSNIRLGLSLEDRLLKLSPLNFTMARGSVRSDISINARRSPVFTDYDIRLTPTPMGRLLAGFGVAEAGTSGTVSGRVKMTGSGNSVHDSLASANGRIAFIMPKGSFWTRNVQLSEIDVGTFVQKMFEDKLKEPVQINCGLIGFTVRNGVAAADPILIDTQKNVMLGRGGFSFKTEAIDLAFRADSKKFSVFAGQSPVGINGYFAKPGFDVISPELVGRAGVGLGLAAVATPVGGLLAFVDVGDAKAAACGPVLAGATAKAQRTTKGKPRDDVGQGTTSKEEDGKASGEEKKTQRKKFLGIF